MWLFSDNCKQTLSLKFGIPLDKIWILSANGTEKRAKAKNILLWVNDKICKYTDLYRDHKNKFEFIERPFFFIYVPKDQNKEEIIKFLKEETQKKVF